MYVYIYCNITASVAKCCKTWLYYCHDLFSQTRSYPSEYEGHLGDLLIGHEEIRARVKDLAALLHKDYADTRPVMLCTLKGACPFYQHLLDALQDLKQGYSMEFLRASSYAGSGTFVSLWVCLTMRDARDTHVGTVVFVPNADLPDDSK